AGARRGPGAAVRPVDGGAQPGPAARDGEGDGEAGAGGHEGGPGHGAGRRRRDPFAARGRPPPRRRRRDRRATGGAPHRGGRAGPGGPAADLSDNVGTTTVKVIRREDARWYTLFGKTWDRLTTVLSQYYKN